MKRLAVLAFAFVALLIVVSVPGSSALPSDDRTDSPQDLYPDADIIVTADDDGAVIVTKRLSEPSEDGSSYTVQKFRQGSNITLADWTDVDGSLSIVFDGAEVNDLVLLSLDSLPESESPVDVSFTMVSGTASSITGVSATYRVESSLPESHFTAYSPVSQLTMDISGDVGELSAMDCLIEIESIAITVSEGASVDRLYPSGEDGRCINLSVVIGGGNVGYMSNQRCVVTYLDYDLRAGSVRYLCIGADVQDGGARTLSDLWTSYVQRDVDVSIGAEMDVGNAILGGGILRAPSMLSNGESPALAQPRNVVIDAPGITVTTTPCFIVSGQDAYDLTDYELGGTPHRTTLRETVGHLSGQIQAYGDGGVWESHSQLSVPSATTLYLDTDLTVPSGTVLSIEPAGTVVNGSFLILYGDLSSSGTYVNNGVTERHEGDIVDGEPIGTGYVATCIYPRPNDGRVDVMTVTDDAVVLRSQSGDMYFNSAMVRFGDTDSWVLVSGPESMYVGGSVFVVALQKVDSGGGQSIWDLHLEGFEAAENSLTVEVSIPARVPSGYTAVVTDSSGMEMEIVTTDGSSGTVTFLATANGTYALTIVPEGEDSGFWIFSDPLVVNATIAIAIVIVASVAVYFLLRRE